MQWHIKNKYKRQTNSKHIVFESESKKFVPRQVLIKKEFLKSEITEAVAQRCSVTKVLLEISQNSQENTCARASFFIKLLAF